MHDLCTYIGCWLLAVPLVAGLLIPGVVYVGPLEALLGACALIHLVRRKEG